MLYDPKWEEKKDGLDRFIAWLERQDPRTKYNWYDCDECMIARYAQEELGHKIEFAYVMGMRTLNEDTRISAAMAWEIGHGIEDRPVWQEVLIGWGLLKDSRWTYGKALKRAYEVRGKRYNQNYLNQFIIEMAEDGDLDELLSSPITSGEVEVHGEI